MNKFHGFHGFLGFLLLLTAGGAFARAGEAPQKTSRDKVYAKEQAARGAAQFAKTCAACHDPAKLDPAKEKGPELIGAKFVEEWQNRPLNELLEVILLTMPNDGSAVLSEEETADVVAHILQANGYPDGPAALKYETGKDILIVK